MKLEILYKPTEEITIESYLQKLGVKEEDVQSYMSPDAKCFESLRHYERMEEGWNLLKTIFGLF